MLDKAIKLISAIFVAYWSLIIFTEFWNRDSTYAEALANFQYYDFLVVVLGIGGGLFWLIKKRKEKILKYFNGLSIFIGLLFINSISISFFYGKLNGLSLKLSGLFSHIGYFIGISLCVFLVYLLIRLLGMLFTSILPLRISAVDRPYIQVALGLMTLTSFLFLLGAMGLLYGFILIPISLFVLFFYWRHSYYIIKETWITPIKIPDHLNVLGIFSFLFLSLFLVFNFTLILRPFPMGSDSLSLYVNLSSLLSEYNGLVSGNQLYNWSLFMSIGLIAFDQMEVVLALSFLGGLLSLFTLFRLSRKWLDVNYSAFILLLFYAMPMISFLSYLDMKVDMGLLFITLSILLVYYNWMVPKKKAKQGKYMKGPGLDKAREYFKRVVPPLLQQNHLLVVIGLLAGFAFGIKMTVLFFFLALHCAIWYFKGSTLTFLSSFMLCFAACFLFKLDAQPGLRQFHQFVPIIQWSLLAIGVGLIIYLFVKQKEQLLKLATISLILGGFFTLPILPWLSKNFMETKQLSVSSLLNGKKESPIFKIENSAKTETKTSQIPDIPSMEKRRNKDLNNSISEDLHRFMGYEITPVRYLSLPYDVFVKTNISKFYTDIGFLLLLLFPILFLFPNNRSKDKKSLLTRLSFIGLCVLLLIVSIPSGFMNQHDLASPSESMELLENTNPTGIIAGISNHTSKLLHHAYTPIHEWISSIYTDKDPITYSILLVLFLLIITLVSIRIKRHAKTTQSMVFFLLMYFFLWWILGSGVAWYGILVFTIPYIFLFKSIRFEEEKKEPFNWGLVGKKGIFLSLGVLSVFLAFVLRTTNYNPSNEEKSKHIYFPSIMEYQTGNLSEEKLTNYHFPNISQFSDIINRDRNALVYQIGTPINFFIDKNDKRVLKDNYMSFFEKLSNSYPVREQLIDVLKSKGFSYIIFDLNMAAYDETPDKTLTQKFTRFMNVIYQNPKLELLATDRRIKLNETGQEVYAVFPDNGSLVYNGKMALYKIK